MAKFINIITDLKCSSRLFQYIQLMLSPLPSLQLRINYTYNYIEAILDQKGHQLAFTNQRIFYTSHKYGIMNSRVAKFLLKMSFRTHIISDLNLNNCLLYDQTFQLISKGNWVNLQKLGMYRNYFTNKVYFHLKKGNWKSLIQIDLTGNNLNGQNSNVLASCVWKKLRKLQLAQNQLNQLYYKKLQTNQWINITCVNLKQTNLGSGCLSVITCMNWPNLQYLYLQKNFITSEGMRSLSKSNWKNLNSLNLSLNHINIDGIRYLSRANWKNLQRINLDNDQISQQFKFGNRSFFYSRMITVGKSAELVKYNANHLMAQFMYIPIKQDCDHPIIKKLRQKYIQSQI